MGGAGMTPAEGGMLLLCMLALAGSTAYMSASLKQARSNQRRAEKMLHELDAKFRNHMKQHERSIRMLSEDIGVLAQRLEELEWPNRAQPRSVEDLPIWKTGGTPKPTIRRVTKE